MFGNVIVDFSLASFILRGNCREECLLARLSKGYFLDPLNSVETLLKNIIRKWFEITFFPTPQPIAIFS